MSAQLRFSTHRAAKWSTVRGLERVWVSRYVTMRMSRHYQAHIDAKYVQSIINREMQTNGYSVTCKRNNRIMYFSFVDSYPVFHWLCWAKRPIAKLIPHCHKKKLLLSFIRTSIINYCVYLLTLKNDAAQTSLPHCPVSILPLRLLAS